MYGQQNRAYGHYDREFGMGSKGIEMMNTPIIMNGVYMFKGQATSF